MSVREDRFKRRLFEDPLPDERGTLMFTADKRERKGLQYRVSFTLRSGGGQTRLFKDFDSAMECYETWHTWLLEGNPVNQYMDRPPQ